MEGATIHLGKPDIFRHHIKETLKSPRTMIISGKFGRYGGAIVAAEFYGSRNLPTALVPIVQSSAQ